MRWFCVLLATGGVLSSPWWTGQARGQSTDAQPRFLLDPISDARVTPVTLTAVRPLEIEGTHASPLPEPSARFAGARPAITTIEAVRELEALAAGRSTRAVERISFGRRGRAH